MDDNATEHQLRHLLSTGEVSFDIFGISSLYADRLVQQVSKRRGKNQPDSSTTLECQRFAWNLFPDVSNLILSFNSIEFDFGHWLLEIIQKQIPSIFFRNLSCL